MLVDKLPIEAEGITQWLEFIRFSKNSFNSWLFWIVSNNGNFRDGFHWYFSKILVGIFGVLNFTGENFH